MKWCQTLTAAFGTRRKLLSKLPSETNKPLHAYYLLVVRGKDRTDASKVTFNNYADA